MNAEQVIREIVEIIDYVESGDNHANYDSCDAYYDIRSVIDSYQKLRIKELTKK